MTAVTPNEPEVEAALGVTIGHDRRRLESAGPRAAAAAQGRARCSSPAAATAWRCSSPGARPSHIPIYGSDQVADVTGAGDTVIATFTLALAAGATPAGGQPARQLRGRHRGHEARDGHGVGGGAAARRGRRPRARPARRAESMRTAASKVAHARRGARARSRRRAPRGAPSPSPTAASTCCTSATCVTSTGARAEADVLVVA